MLFVTTVSTIVCCSHLPLLLSQICYLWLLWPTWFVATIHNFCHRDVICCYCGHHSLLRPPSKTSVTEILFTATGATIVCCGDYPQLLSQICYLWLLWPPQFAVATIHNLCYRDAICSYCGHHSFLWPPSTTSVKEMLFVAIVTTTVCCGHLPQLLSQRYYLWLLWPPEFAVAIIHNFYHRDVICSYCGHHSYLWPPSTTSVTEMLFAATVATIVSCGHHPQLLSQRCYLWLLWPP